MTQNLLTPGEFKWGQHAGHPNGPWTQVRWSIWHFALSQPHLSIADSSDAAAFVLITKRALMGSSVCSMQVLVKCWSSSFTWTCQFWLWAETAPLQDLTSMQNIPCPSRNKPLYCQGLNGSDALIPFSTTLASIVVIILNQIVVVAHSNLWGWRCWCHLWWFEIGQGLSGYGKYLPFLAQRVSCS